MQRLFNIFLAIFVFTTFNREFRVLGFDLRYAAVAAGLLLVFAEVYRRARHGERSAPRLTASAFSNWDLALFYFVLFASSIGWLWNGLPLGDQFAQLMILNASNAVYVLAFSLCSDLLDVRTMYRYSFASLGVLALSMMWVYGGNDLPDIFHDNSIRVGHVGESGNLFGESVRVAGFAEDANYACMFSAIGFVLAVSYFPKGDLRKYGLIAIFAFCFAISFSRTIAVGLVAACLAAAAYAILKRSWNTVAWIMTVCIILFALYGLSHISALNSSASMTTRFMLWGNAEDVFMQSPLIGGGLSSVRSATNVLYGGTWYVQCHSTFWQILAEHGLAGMLVFALVLARRFAFCRTRVQIFAVTVFAMLCMTSEFEYQQFFVFMLALYPFVIAREEQVSVSEELDSPSRPVHGRVGKARRGSRIGLAQ